MYSGKETLIDNGKYLEHSMLEFWQEYMSDIQDNMTRGTFGEFIVRSALEDGLGLIQSDKVGKAPYDLVGPSIPALNRNARIEVKTSSNIQKWTITARPTFGISPAKLPAKNGDFLDTVGRQRNNDLYVFCFYNADNTSRNMLDLSYWEFYIIATQTIKNHSKLWKNKSITLEAVMNLATKVSYHDLSNAIVNICSQITDDHVHYFLEGQEPILIPCPGINYLGDNGNQKEPPFPATPLG